MPNIKDARILIVSARGFEQDELIVPRDRLREAGAHVDVASPDGKPIRGWNHTDWGKTVDADMKIADAKPSDYDALVIPGGQINPDLLRVNEDALKLVRGFLNDGSKTVAAICHGPWTLVEAGVLKGRTITSWPSLKTDIRNAGGQWVDEEVHTDMGLVTSRKPDDLPAFCAKAIEEFREGIHDRQKKAA